MMDISSTARTISQWPTLVGAAAIPASVMKAVEMFDAAEYIEGPYTGVDPSTIRMDTIEETMVTLAVQYAQEEQFAKAKHQVRDALGRQLLQTAGTAVEDIKAAIRPDFDRAVEVFTSAVEVLPDDLDATALIRRGTDAVGQYTAAVEAQQIIKAADSFLASLTYLPRFAGARQDNAIRILAPEDRNQLQKLVNAAGTPSKKLGDLIPLYVVAVKESIPFTLHDPSEWTALRRDIEAAKYEPKRPTFLRFA